MTWRRGVLAGVARSFDERTSSSSGSVHEELDAVVEAIDRQAADLRHPLMSTDQLLHGLGTPV